MANSVTTQLLQDGRRNCILKLTAQLPASGGSDIAYFILVSPNVSQSAPGIGPLSYIDADNTYRPSFLNIQKIDYNLTPGITAQLWWDQGGSSTFLAQSLFGRNKFEYADIGQLPNNATSATGAIALSTIGYAAGTASDITLILWCNKLTSQ